MLNMHASAEGYYTLQRVKEDGTVVETLGPFKNLITDQGLNGLGNVTDAGKLFNVSYCFVGSSNTPPANSNVSLGNQIASIAGGVRLNPTGVQDGSDYVVSASYVYSFPAGRATGNLSEIGVGSASLNGGDGRPGAPPNYLFSRALIVDGSGNPTTITILADEILNVTYTIKWYIPTAVSTTTVVDSTTGISHTINARLVDVGNIFTELGGPIRPTVRIMGTPYYQSSAGTPITFSPSLTGTLSGATAMGNFEGNPVNAAYVDGSYKTSSSGMATLGEANNAAGIGGFVTFAQSGWGGALTFRTGFIITPAIMKNATKVLNLTLSITWARRP